VQDQPVRVGEAGARGRSRRGDALFLALALVTLLPLWTVRHLPTVDGPAHVYNAGILLHLATGDGDFPRFDEYYEINPRPVPNWLSHAVLALLLTLFPSDVAEKLLVSGCVLLFLFGLRYLAASIDGGWRDASFLGFPFVYHWPLQMGFYNFSISLGFFLFAAGFWWRRRHGLDLRRALALNGLLLLTWFSHILSLGLALASIGVLWLVTLPTEPFRRHLVHPAFLAPQLLLPLWYMGSRSETSYAESWSVAFAWDYLRHLNVLWTFGPEQFRFGTVVAVLFVLLVVLAFLRGNLRAGEAAEGRLRLRFDEVDGFLLLAGILTVLFFVAPGAAAGGGLVQERLSLYPWLVLVPWLAARLRPGRWTGAAIAGFLLAAALWNTAYQTRWYRRLDRETTPYLAGLERVPPGTRVVALLFDRNGSAARVSPFGHLIARTALAKGLVDWDNHGASTDSFPIRFKPPIVAPDLTGFYTDPAHVWLRGWRGRVDYLYAWKMPPKAPIARRLHRHHRLVAHGGGGKLFAIEP
jgi:hypothetical protein